MIILCSSDKWELCKHIIVFQKEATESTWPPSQVCISEPQWNKEGENDETLSWTFRIDTTSCLYILTWCPVLQMTNFLKCSSFFLFCPPPLLVFLAARSPTAESKINERKLPQGISNTQKYHFCILYLNDHYPTSWFLQKLSILLSQDRTHESVFFPQGGSCSEAQSL